MSVPQKPGPVVPRPIPEDPRAPVASEVEPGSVGEDRIYLAGRPSLRGFVHYVQAHARQPTDRASLVEQWQAARARLTVLERQEAGAADHPLIANLGHDYESLLTEFFRNPLVKRSFNTLQTDISLVPHDQRIGCMTHV